MFVSQIYGAKMQTFDGLYIIYLSFFVNYNTYTQVHLYQKNLTEISQ